MTQPLPSRPIPAHPTRPPATPTSRGCHRQNQPCVTDGFPAPTILQKDQGSDAGSRSPAPLHPDTLPAPACPRKRRHRVEALLQRRPTA
jgi:hypothetical protein